MIQSDPIPHNFYSELTGQTTSSVSIEDEKGRIAELLKENEDLSNLTDFLVNCDFTNDF